MLVDASRRRTVPTKNRPGPFDPDAASRVVESTDEAAAATVPGRCRRADRIAYQHPEKGEAQDGNTFIVESQIDKPELFNLLLTLFKIPWQSDKDFVVRWGLANRNPDSLKIRSLRLHREPEPPHWQEW